MFAQIKRILVGRLPPNTNTKNGSAKRRRWQSFHQMRSRQSRMQPKPFSLFSFLAGVRRLVSRCQLLPRLRCCC